MDLWLGSYVILAGQEAKLSFSKKSSKCKKALKYLTPMLPFKSYSGSQMFLYSLFLYASLSKTHFILFPHW